MSQQRLLTEKQKEALVIAQSGHNLAILGQAGVGKTYVVKFIKKELLRDGLRVAVTCTTGIACANFEDAMTIHRFCGIKDGRHSLEELIVMLNSESSESAKQRLQQTDVLIIDEISMLSYKMLCQVEAVCRIVRGNDSMFGGIQVLVSGDFWQLPPVPNSLYHDEGLFAFSGPLWIDGFPHRVILDEVIRQEEKVLITTIAELGKGVVSKVAADFLDQLDHQISEEEDAIRLFATNQQTDIWNQQKISSLPGDLKVFYSEDWGDKKRLEKLLIPKTLWVKLGCTVMLLSNLSDTLVNGSIGTVRDIQDKYIEVEFRSISVRIEKHSFGVYDPNLKSDVARRVQFPLKLCYALTVHKSQGMTLDKVVVDCEGMFRPGQLGVAIGRARRIDGLRVVNFRPESVLQQDDILFEFYEGGSMPLLDDMACCQHVNTAGEKNIYTIADGPGEVFDEADDADLLQAYTECMGEEPNEVESDEDEGDLHFDLAAAMDILKRVAPKVTVTTFQKRLLEKVEETTPKSQAVVVFCAKSVNTIAKYFSQTVDVAPKNQNIQDFYTRCHIYMNSNKFKSTVTELFGENGEIESHLSYKIFTHVREEFLKQKQEQAVEQTEPEDDLNTRYADNLNDASRMKIRYLAGYCFRKQLVHCTSNINNNLFKESERSKETVHREVLNKRFIQQALRSQGQILKETQDVASLSEVRRKQNLREGLLHVTDSAFDFTAIATKKCVKLQSEQNLHRYGSHIHLFVAKKLKDDKELYRQWIHLFHAETTHRTKSKVSDVQMCLDAVVDRVMSIEQMYNDFLELLTRVLSRQFLNDILESWQVKKKEAHRKEIKISKKASNVNPGGKGKGKGKGKVNPADGSRTDGKGKGKRKEKGTTKMTVGTMAAEFPCGICEGESIDNCVSCDLCEKWFHAECLSLSDLDSLPDEWFCPQCT